MINNTKYNLLFCHVLLSFTKRFCSVSEIKNKSRSTCSPPLTAASVWLGIHYCINSYNTNTKYILFYNGPYEQKVPLFLIRRLYFYTFLVYLSIVVSSFNGLFPHFGKFTLLEVLSTSSTFVCHHEHTCRASFDFWIINLILLFTPSFLNYTTLKL